MHRNWQLTTNKKNRTINFHWINFYVSLYKLFLSGLTTLNNYEWFVNRSNILMFFNKNLTPSLSFTKQLNITPLSDYPSNIQSYWDRIALEPRLPKKLFIHSNTREFSLFLMYIQFSNSYAGNFVLHAQLRSMFITQEYGSHTVPYINVTKFHARWVNSYNFLFNLFCSNVGLLMFCPKTFKKEALSFNWSSELLEHTLFKQAAPHFVMKDVSYGEHSTEAFISLRDSGLDVAFLTDIKYHQRTLFYLKTNKIYTIALIPYNMSPWLVHWCILASSNGIYMQYYFIKLLCYIRQQAENYHYNNFKRMWYLS